LDHILDATRPVALPVAAAVAPLNQNQPTAAPSAPLAIDPSEVTR
jgi:hypothetical protein